MNIVLPHLFNMALECLFRSRPHADGETFGGIADWHPGYSVIQTLIPVGKEQSRFHSCGVVPLGTTSDVAPFDQATSCA